MNTWAKGQRIERELRDMLVTKGLLVHSLHAFKFAKQRSEVDFTGSRDFWGCMDVLSRHPVGKQLLLFQVSTTWKTGDALRYIEDFDWFPFERVYLVRKKARTPFEFRLWNPHLRTWVDLGNDIEF